MFKHVAITLLTVILTYPVCQAHASLITKCQVAVTQKIDQVRQNNGLAPRGSFYRLVKKTEADYELERLQDKVERHHHVVKVRAYNNKNELLGETPALQLINVSQLSPALGIFSGYLNRAGEFYNVSRFEIVTTTSSSNKSFLALARNLVAGSKTMTSFNVRLATETKIFAERYGLKGATVEASEIIVGRWSSNKTALVIPHYVREGDQISSPFVHIEGLDSVERYSRTTSDGRPLLEYEFIVQ